MMTLGFALLSDTYPSNQLGAEMGKVLIGQTLGLMVGPPIGGVLEDRLGEKAPYVFCIVLIAIDLTARLLIIEPRAAKVKAIRKFQKQQKQQANNQKDVDNSGGSTQLLSKKKAGELATILGLLSNKRLATALVVSFIQAFLVAGTPLQPCQDSCLDIQLLIQLHLSTN
jgi:MFS family permease